MKTRRAGVEITYKNKDITNDIGMDLISFTYNDNASGSADDISIELKDDKGKWITGWAPTKGDVIKPRIITVNWRKDGSFQSRDCGSFLVDEPSYRGRPRVLSLGAVALPSATGFISTQKSQTWQQASLLKIAQSIASSANYKLIASLSSDPILSYIEQSKQTDAAFLLELCQKNGLAMKVYNDEIVIFSEVACENKDPQLTLTENDFLSWSAKTTWTDIYDGCKIAYKNPSTGELISYTFQAPDKNGGKIYQINESVDSLAEAQQVVQNKLRELNKNEYTLSLEIPGNLELRAAHTVTISDLGIYKGKYYIDKISHKIQSGFTSSLELHKVLEGY
jgi:uncharacterized protein